MKKWRIYLICLFGTLQLSAFADEPQRVYLFGVSTNFNDSIVYITDVQHLDSMVMNQDGSLRNYVGYSLQMKVYLEGTLGESNQTCAIIYSDKKRQLEKRFFNTRRKFLSGRGKTLRPIGTDAFKFKKL